MKSNLPTHCGGSELAIAAVAAFIWSLLGITLGVLNPTPSKGWEQPSTGNPQLPERRAVATCEAMRGGNPDATSHVESAVNEVAEGTAIRKCQNTPSTPNAASCRIHNQLSGGANVGSGTLIDIAPGGERGLILTCAHLFTEGTGQVVVEFPSGKRHGALVVAIDHQADLAALEIARPPVAAVEVNQQTAAGNLMACGFGPIGAYRCIAGPTLGYSEGPGQTSVRIGGAVRSGDSGGGVFDDRGRLVGVVWGESGGVTYASTGRPLGRFLERVLGRRVGGGTSPSPSTPSSSSSGAICPGGTCPLIGGRLPAPLITPPAAAPLPAAPNQPCDCGDALATIAARLEAMESQRPPSLPDGDALSGGELPSSSSGAARTATMLATNLLGVCGPAGWGVIAASTVGGWLLGRRLKKRKRRAVSRELREEEPTSPTTVSSPSQLATHDSPLNSPTEATAAAVGAFPAACESTGSSDDGLSIAIDQQAPIERDDCEARELLRLSQLEGRDPLQDAVAGRLALDRLDALAESDGDPHHVAWADRLRRELRERFNEIAPTKFQINGEC
jgi:hypothetical protein